MAVGMVDSKEEMDVMICLAAGPGPGPGDHRMASGVPGVFVPASGLTAVQELARILGLWEVDVDDGE